MNLVQLLSQRDAVLRQAQLSNLAFAYHQLTVFSDRLARSGLRGKVTLRHAAPEQEQYCATLTAVHVSQSVIEEHFTEPDIMDLADVIAFLFGQHRLELTFSVEEFAGEFLLPLRQELARLDVKIDSRPAARLPAAKENRSLDGIHQQEEAP